MSLGSAGFAGAGAAFCFFGCACCCAGAGAADFGASFTLVSIFAIMLSNCLIEFSECCAMCQ